MFVARMATRSLGRNRRRVLITTLATALAGFMMIFWSTLFEGMMKTFERSVVAMEAGDLQAHAPGYRKDPDLYQRIENGDALADRLTRLGLAAAPRLYTYGLAASGKSSAGVELRGIDLAREAKVTEIHKHVRDGEWLSNEAPNGIVLGRKLARSLNVKVGGEVVLLGTAADGSMANDIYRVRGILAGISERADRSGLFMVDASFRALMVLPEGCHELAIARGIATLEEAKRVAMGERPELEVMTWRELQPSVAQMIDSADAGRFFMVVIFYGAIAMLILNATLMSVFERIREFGVMKALGVTPGQVVSIILLEVTLQAAIASLVAVAAAWPLSLYLEKHGWDLSWAAGDSLSVSGIALDTHWYASVSADGILFPVVSLFFMVGLASIYPGLKAAFISPLEAIYHR